MAESTELRLNLPADRARDVVAAGLRDQGFSVSSTPSGVLQVERGSLGATIAVGAMAGDNLHIKFDVRVDPAESGSVVVVEQSALGGFFKGGAIGASKSKDVVQNAVHQLGASLAAQGFLEGQVPPAASSEAVSGAPAGANAAAAPAAAGEPGAPGAYIPPPVDYANRTNIVAIFALILGFLVPIGGIIAGIVALLQIKRTGEKGRGLAIAGIAVGSVVTVIGTIVLIAFAAFIATGVANEAASDAPYSQNDDPQQTDPGTDSGGGDVSLPAAPTVGDCIDETETGLVFPGCDVEHDYEVYSTFMLKGDAFPGDDSVVSQADAGCVAAFPTFVGTAFEESTLGYSYIAPNESTWAEGDREIICVVYDPAGKTVGTLAGSAR